MFTGIIEEIGHIETIQKGARSLVLTISGKKIFPDMTEGCSISVNGVCLTVTSFGGHQFTADMMPESAGLTTFLQLKKGTPVNLERAMSASGRFGGHMVAGHVDGTGRIEKITRNDNSIIFRISARPEVMRYIIYKGSIAVDGISLTVSAATDQYFEISIIPHTIKETILQFARVGTEVNLETDITGRYIEQFMRLGNKDGMSVKSDRGSGLSASAKSAGQGSQGKGLTKEKLIANGFI